MPGLARMTDIGVGTCCCHSKPTCRGMVGTIVNGASVTSTEGLPQGHFGSIVIGGCGHVGIIVGGMSSANVEGLGGPAQITNPFVGCFTGTIVTGASKTVG